MDYLNFSPATWVMLYFGVWILAIAWSAVFSSLSRKNPKMENARDSGIATLALIAGGLAVAFVVIGLNANPGVLILLVLAAGAGAVGFSSLMLGEKLILKR